MKTCSRLSVASLSRAVLGVATLTALGLLGLSGCGRHSTLVPWGENQRPTVTLGAQVQEGDPHELTAPLFYRVHLRWEASDPDGEIAYFLYGVDPPAEGDTAWTRCDEPRLTLSFRASTPDSASAAVPFTPAPVTSRDYHVFVLKAVDDDGAFSPPAHVAFTSFTVAPATAILDPLPNRLLSAITPTDVLIRWTGEDPDGVLSPEPVRYRFKLAPQSVIQEALGIGTRMPSQAELQQFFSEGLPAAFAWWDSVPADTTWKQYEGLTPGQHWYFAVSALDEAGAWEPRFNLDSNLLRFKPDTILPAPRITINADHFTRTQPTGGFDLSDIYSMEAAEGRPVSFFWEATPHPGTVLGGYRWCLDIEDVFDETPRENESQTDRWSEWSLTEQAATVGPFIAEADTDYTTEPPTVTLRDRHRFYVEARSNTGAMSLAIVEIHVVRLEFPEIPFDQRRFLVFDDYRGNSDRTLVNYAPYGTFPTESALDTLLYARGGFPFRYPPYRLSDPGVFAGFPYDTLDYRFTMFSGLPLSLMSRYSAIVWYTSMLDAAMTGSKFSRAPMGALRFINTAGATNTLAVYLDAGGHVWLFGDGAAAAIANGYVSRFSKAVAFFPYMSGGTEPGPDQILWPGNFLYDYMKLRSQLDRLGASAGDEFSDVDNLVAMTPYLPEYRTPGAPWPPDGWTGGRGPSDDPRVGPSASRHIGRWAGQPMLTMTTEFSYWPTPLPTSTDDVPYVSLPNEITEGAPPVSVLDTLYLYRAKEYKLDARRVNPDGKPVWFHYWGAEHGQVDWTSAPIWLFERTRLQLVADRVLAQFGFYRQADPRSWTGPGAVGEAEVRASPQ